MIKRFVMIAIIILASLSLTACEEPGRRHGPDTVGSATKMMGMRFPGKKPETKNDNIKNEFVVVSAVLGSCLLGTKLVNKRI